MTYRLPAMTRDIAANRHLAAICVVVVLALTSLLLWTATQHVLKSSPSTEPTGALSGLYGSLSAISLGWAWFLIWSYCLRAAYIQAANGGHIGIAASVALVPRYSALAVAVFLGGLVVTHGYVAILVAAFVTAGSPFAVLMHPFSAAIFYGAIVLAVWGFWKLLSVTRPV